MTDHAELGRALSRLREIADLSVNDLAARSEVSRQTIHKVESGRPARLRTLARIVRAIGPGNDPTGQQERLYSRLAASLGLLDEAEVPPTPAAPGESGARLRSLAADIRRLDAELSRVRFEDFKELPREEVNDLLQSIEAVRTRILDFRRRQWPDLAEGSGPLIGQRGVR